MAEGIGRVFEVREGLSDPGVDTRSAYIACSPQLIPSPGQYLVAATRRTRGEWDMVPLPETLFPAWIPRKSDKQPGFWAASPVDESWIPGTALHLRGPLGRGFHLPAQARHLAAVALGPKPDRILPLVLEALQTGWEATMFLPDQPVDHLPAAVEILPLHAIQGIWGRVDFLAVALNRDQFGDLRIQLGLSRDDRLPCPTQVLIHDIMPCAGLAECGICAVTAKRGWKLSCVDGPVFNLEDLAW